jgi:hypothetical protein
MATSTILSNPVVTIGGIDMTDQTTAATLTRTVEALESTAFGSTSRVYTGGLENNELTVTMYLSYAASETYATIAPLVGTQLNVIVKPTNAVDSATNPAFILTGTYLEALPVINASLGELQTVDLVFTGGVYSADITNP